MTIYIVKNPSGGERAEASSMAEAKSIARSWVGGGKLFLSDSFAVTGGEGWCCYGSRAERDLDESGSHEIQIHKIY